MELSKIGKLLLVCLLCVALVWGIVALVQYFIT